ncbi:ABC transporter substrate-binding protein [Williamsia sp.]|uniref:ABC transporter substrate-binding protein n=1 Tax=Williamsia sp. TaxID=1872085 RepID=UPI002F94AAD4
MYKNNGQRGAQVVAALVTIVTLTALSACSDDSGNNDDPSSATIEAPEGSYPGKVAIGEPVKIGLINPEGGQAISSPENRETAEAVVQYANENLAGIGGRPIEMISCKDHEEPASARDCANQMVEAKVSAVVVTTTGLGNIMAPIITGAGIPYISASGGSSEEATRDSSYLWTGGYPENLTAMAIYAGQQGYKSVTAYTIDVPTAVGGLTAIGVPAFKAQGIDLKVVTIPLGTADATPQVSAGIADNPEAVVVVGDATFCTTALKPLGTLGYSGEKLLLQTCATPTVVDAVGSSINESKVFSIAQTVGDHPETLLYKSIMDKYSPDTDISGYAYVGYQGMLGLVRATQSVQGTDTSPAAVNAAIKSAKDVVLPAGGGLTFTCDGTISPTMKAVCGKGTILLTLEDGQLVDPEVIVN